MRFRNLIRGDIHFQWKYGFYFVYFVITLLYICIIAALPEQWKKTASAMMIYSDPAAMGLFFMGAVVLLEKSQKVLNAMALSPVTISEYILSKTIAFIGISTVVALALGIASGSRNLFGIAAGTALSSAIFTMIGMIAAANIASLNQFMIVIMPIELICLLPPVAGLFVELPAIIRFFPLTACMNLFTGESSFWWLDLASALAMLLVLYVIALRMVSHMWRSLGGVKL